MLTKLKKHVTPKQIWNDLVFFALLNLGLIATAAVLFVFILIITLLIALIRKSSR